MSSYSATPDLSARMGVPRKVLYAACALSGTGLILVGAELFRSDHIRCTNWPPLTTGYPYALAYVVALTLLTIGWLGLSNLGAAAPPYRLTSDAASATGSVAGRPAVSLSFILLVGIACNVLATLVPPFLADDGLAYIAVGRALGVYHKDMFAPLGESLPLSDPVRIAISSNYGWLSVGSAYGPGFNWLAGRIALLSGQDVALSLHLFQLCSTAAAVLAAVVAGRAAFLFVLGQPSGAAGSQALHRAAQAAGNRATALVLLCPLTIIEAANNAHNDSFLMLSVAVFALCVVRGRTLLALGALLAALLIKASALLLVGLYGVHLVAAAFHFRLPALKRRYIFAALAAAISLTVVLAFELLPWLMRYSNTSARLLGSPNDEYPYCTRSLECLPRAFLHMVLGRRTAAWLVGLGFRALAGAFLLFMALRSERGTAHLRYAASFIFFYYLLLHGYSQPWYVLSLLPLLPYAERRYLPAMLALPLSNLAYYTLDFPYNCDHSVFMVALTETLQGLIVLVPPIVLLVKGRPAPAAA